MKIHFKIATPERVVYESEVDSVTCPTQMGEITVLPNHIPLVANLKAGELKIVENGQQKFIALSGGFIEVRPLLSPLVSRREIGGDDPGSPKSSERGFGVVEEGVEPSLFFPSPRGGGKGRGGEESREGSRSRTEVIILADAAEYAEEIDIKRAQEARGRAQKIMAEKTMGAEEFAATAAALERALSRLKVARRRHQKTLGKTPESIA